LALKTVRTERLEIAFEEGGPIDGPPVMLLHGWPDAPRGWTAVAAGLEAKGWRTVTPYLRGFGSTRFLSADTPRVGTALALAQDAIDLADVLGLQRFAVVGHDWGARTVYILSALFPERITSLVALSVGFAPRGVIKAPSFEQSRLFWYQWFQCTEPGAARVKEDPVGFARIQWDTWSPPKWFEEAEFLRTAESFSNPDWASITLNYYRSRWLKGEASEPQYDELEKKLHEVEVLSTSTLMVQGAEDRCVAPNETEGQESRFSGGYERVLLEGVGHFPQREAPAEVTAVVLRHLSESRTR
jgi:pimeloyl-ACP methyl ester carboxylesterase